MKGKKYKVTGPEGEVIGIYFREKDCHLMAGSVRRVKPFLDHICFKILGLCGADITRENERQGHKFRYYFDVNVETIKTAFYSLREKYKVEEVESIVDIT